MKEIRRRSTKGFRVSIADIEFQYSDQQFRDIGAIAVICTSIEDALESSAESCIRYAAHPRYVLQGLTPDMHADIVRQAVKVMTCFTDDDRSMIGSLLDDALEARSARNAIVHARFDGDDIGFLPRRNGNNFDVIMTEEGLAFVRSFLSDINYQIFDLRWAMAGAAVIDGIHPADDREKEQSLELFQESIASLHHRRKSQKRTPPEWPQEPRSPTIKIRGSRRSDD